jgi:hypothetical protein
MDAADNNTEAGADGLERSEVEVSIVTRLRDLVVSSEDSITSRDIDPGFAESEEVRAGGST